MTVEFGTDGIRGRAGELPCTEEVGRALGAAIVRVLGASRVLIARDPRPSGPMLARAVADGVRAAGGEPFDGGMIPTSGLAAALEAGFADAGAMITASHNPVEDNGFKVLDGRGRKLTDAQNAAIEAALAVGSVPASPVAPESLERLVHFNYERALSQAVGRVPSLENKRIAIDLANGAASAVPQWLASLGFEVVRVDGGGAVNDGVGSEHPERACEVVVSGSCDAGLLVDGDGDRCRLVDERGVVVDGDALAWLLATARGAKSMAVTIMSTTGLEAALPDVKITRTPVGDRHLSEAIERGLAEFGVEESGHVVFSDALPTGDGLVTGLRALALAFSRAPTLSAAIPFTPFPRRLTKVRVRQRPAIDSVPALVHGQREGEQSLGEFGRVFLRYSGTEPVLRILVEGQDSATVNAVSEHMTELATEALQ